MAKRKPNRFVGRSIREFAGEQRGKDREFAEEWDNRQLARRIRALRMARKLTQEELARRVATTQSATGNGGLTKACMLTFGAATVARSAKFRNRVSAPVGLFPERPFRRSFAMGDLSHTGKASDGNGEPCCRRCADSHPRFGQRRFGFRALAGVLPLPAVVHNPAASA